MEGKDVVGTVGLAVADARPERLVVGLEDVPVSLEEVLGRFRGHGAVSEGPASDLSSVEHLGQLTLILKQNDVSGLRPSLLLRIQKQYTH